MSGSSYDRRKARRAAQRRANGAPVVAFRPIAQPEPRGEAEGALPSITDYREWICEPMSDNLTLRKILSQLAAEQMEAAGLEAKGVLVEVAYLEQSILKDPLWTRAKDQMWIQAFKEHGKYGKPAGCRPCYAKVLQWYKMGKPEEKTLGGKVVLDPPQKKRSLFARIWLALRKLVPWNPSR